MFTRAFRLLLGLLFLLSPAGPAWAERTVASAPYCQATQWPHELSDLAPDPNLHFGRLDNGFRYVLREHNEPRERTAMFLAVLAGSVHEDDSEKGLAHFLEHMLFNGSTHFAPGELTDYFQSIGMSFGGDTNAHTAYDETVYRIILPRSGHDDLDGGLLVLSDFARGALLLESEVDRERGVILAEMTARDSAGYRAWVAESSFTLRGTRAAERMPIGEREIIEHADREQLQSFYDAWYRPETMVLVLVGDFQRDVAETLIDKHFAGLTAIGEPRPCPDLGRLEHGELESFHHYEPQLGYTEVIIETVANKDPENDALALQQRNLLDLMAGRMINDRLNRQLEAPETPFASAGYYSTVLFDRFRMVGLRAKTAAAYWQESLTELDTMLRQVIRYGFTDEELDRVKRQLLAELDHAVQTKQTRNSQAMARSVVGHVRTNRVLQDPEQERTLFAPVVDAVTTQMVWDHVVEQWQTGSRLVKMVGDALGNVDDGAALVLEHYRLLQQTPIEKPEASAEVAFPYVSIPAAPLIDDATENFADIDAVRYRFANGLVVNAKQTDFQQQTVAVQAHFGSGNATLPKAGLDLLAAAVVNGSGTGRYKRSELRDVLAGSSVRHQFRIGEESFVWEGQALVDDLELLFQVLQAQLYDPGFRPEAYELAMQNFALMYQQLERDVDGGVRMLLEPFFAGGVPGFGLPARESFFALRLDDVRQWLEPQFAGAKVELSAAGDVAPERVRELAGRYLGGEREAAPVAEPLHTPRFPAGETLQTTIDSDIDKAIIRMAWQTDDFWDINRSRRLHVLADVFEDRLRRAVRERLGASYSPFVFSTTSRVHAGFGMLVAQVVAESSLLPAVQREIEAVAASLRSEPVSEEELQRAKRPMETMLRQSIRSNDYWLRSVLTLSSRHEEQLRWPLTMIDDFGAVTTAEVTELAERYLIPERRATGIVVPAEGGDAVVERSVN